MLIVLYEIGTEGVGLLAMNGVAVGIGLGVETGVGVGDGKLFETMIIFAGVGELITVGTGFGVAVGEGKGVGFQTIITLGRVGVGEGFAACPNIVKAEIVKIKKLKNSLFFIETSKERLKEEKTQAMSLRHNITCCAFIKILADYKWLSNML